MSDVGKWRKREKGSSGASVITHLCILLMFGLLSISAMMVSCMTTVIMNRYKGVDKGDFANSSLLSLNNLWMTLLCVVPGGILSIFILIAMRDGISGAGLCIKSAVLLVYGAVSTGLGAGYVIKEHFEGFIRPQELAGVMSEVGVMLISIIGIYLAAFGCCKNTLYNFVAAGSIFGCLLGAIRAYQVETYFGDMIIDGAGYSLGRIFMYTSFYCGGSAIAASMVAKTHLGYSISNHAVAIILPIALAGAFGCFTTYPGYPSSLIPTTVGRYCIGAATTALSCALAVVAFLPLRVKIQHFEVREDTAAIKFAKSLMTSAAIGRSESGTSTDQSALAV